MIRLPTAGVLVPRPLFDEGPGRADTAGPARRPPAGQYICHNQLMAARSAQHDGAAAFTAPAQVNQRRYEALRAYYVEGLTYARPGNGSATPARR